MKLKKIIIASGILSAGVTAFGANLSWDTDTTDGATITGGDGTWNTTNTNWNTGSGNTSWVNANKDLAIFGGTAGTVTLGSDITASGITFSSGYTIAGGGFTLTLDNGANPAVISKNASGTISANLASTGAVTITGSSNLSLTGNNTGLTGAVNIGGANTVTLGNANALGTAAVTITAGNLPALAFGSAFTLNNAITLGSGSSLWTAGSNTLTFGNNVTLAGNAGITLWGRNARIDGTLALGSNTFTVSQSGTSTLSLTLAGPITGTGSITMNAANNKTLILANTAAANTYSGGTTITAGTVSLGTGGTTADTSHVGALGTGAVSINTGGILRLWIRNNASFNIANNLTINGGTLRNEDGNHTMTGTVAIGTGGATFQSVWSGKNMAINGIISGSGPVTVQGNGSEVRFVGANTYTGATTVSNGTLVLNNANASSGFSIASGATLALRTITLGSSQNITGAGTVTKDISTFGASTINGNNNTYTGATTVNIDRFTVGSTGVINGTSGITVQAQWGANFNNLGSVTTPGTISVLGTGNTTGGGVTTDSSFFRNSGTVNAANINLNSSATANTTANRGGTYSQSAGTTTVTGALTLSANGGIGAAGTAGNDAALNLTGGTINTPVLAVDAGTVTATGGTLNVGSGGITSAGGRPIAINLGATTLAASASWSSSLAMALTDSVTGTTIQTGGGDIALSGPLSGSGKLLKTGAGVLSLTGTNSYTGTTTVGDGTLVVGVGGTGSITSNVTINNGGTLGGSGTITGTVDVKAGGTHNAGNSPGIQSIIGNTTYETGSIFAWDLNSNAVGTRGTNYDGVTITGNLTVQSGALFRVIQNTGVDFNDTFWETNQSWTDIFSVSGTLAGWAASSAVSVYNTSNVLQDVTAYGSFSITGTTLNWTAIPEPGTALGGLLLAAGLLRRRR